MSDTKPFAAAQQWQVTRTSTKGKQRRFTMTIKAVGKTSVIATYAGVSTRIVIPGTAVWENNNKVTFLDKNWTHTIMERK